jgi:hypothetical protein
MCEREMHASTGERDERDLSSAASHRPTHGAYGDKRQPQHIRKQYPYEAHANCKLDPTQPVNQR